MATLCDSVSSTAAHVGCATLKAVYGGGSAECTGAERAAARAVDVALRDAVCSASSAACSVLVDEASRPSWSSSVASEALSVARCGS